MADPHEALPRTGGHLFFAALASVSLALAAVPGALAALAFVRASIGGGEWWRLATGHLVHGSVAHLVWNLAGLAIVWLAFGPRLGGRAWALAFAVSALGTGLGVLAFAPEVGAMAGLSGAVHGLAVAGSVAAVRDGERVGWVFLALVAVKVAWEQIAGASAAVAGTLGAPIAVDAHLYGSLSGAIAAAFDGRR